MFLRQQCYMHQMFQINPVINDLLEAMSGWTGTQWPPQRPSKHRQSQTIAYHRTVLKITTCGEAVSYPRQFVVHRAGLQLSMDSALTYTCTLGQMLGHCYEGAW